MRTILKSRMQSHLTNAKWPWGLLCLHTQPGLPSGSGIRGGHPQSPIPVWKLHGALRHYSSIPPSASPQPCDEECLQEQMFIMRVQTRAPK